MKELTKSEILWMRKASCARADIISMEDDPNNVHISNEYLLYVRGGINAVKEVITTLTDEWTEDMEKEFVSIRKRLNKLKLWTKHKNCTLGN